jgi:hypothetical protein
MDLQDMRAPRKAGIKSFFLDRENEGQASLL